MKRAANPFKLRHRADTPAGRSPYRLYAGEENEVEAVNSFLDFQAVRGLSSRTLRSYGYSLLAVWRWLAETERAFEGIGVDDLEAYIRFQKDAGAAATTINHQLTALRGLYRFHFDSDIPKATLRFRSHPYHDNVASANGYLHPVRSRARQLRVKTARRLVVPLTCEEVQSFLATFRSRRDVAIVTLMLLCGLRSRELVELELDELSLVGGEVRVRGKGEKERVVPLPCEVIGALRSYLELERPSTPTPALFVLLKGARRGQPMTAAGLRSLFRYHRRIAGVARANPHRFRHTFGAEMARAGISLAVLKKLMGHADIHTTMGYVELSDKDVNEEFHRVRRSATRTIRVDEHGRGRERQ